MSNNQPDALNPRKPVRRTLLWPDSVLDIQDILLNLPVNAPLYIVGGAVRDAFLSRPVKDLDLATPGHSIQIARQLTDALDADIFIMDDERGVARVLHTTPEGRLTIDIARFRGDDLLADLQDRDFTMNAMAVDLRGDLQHIIDPLNGEKDIEEKRIRRCNPHAIADDPIRILRAVRQSVQLGTRLDPDTVQDMRDHAADIHNPSAERLRDAFFQILMLYQQTPQALRVLDTLGILQHIIPETARLHNLTLPDPHRYNAWKTTIEAVKQMNRLLTTVTYRRTADDASTFDMGMLAMQFDRFRQNLHNHIHHVWPSEREHGALLLLGALLHSLNYLDDIHPAERAANYADALRLSNPEKKRLVLMMSHYQQALSIAPDDALAQHRYWYTVGEAGIDALLLGIAVYLATHGLQIDQDDWLIQIERGMMLLYAYYLQHDTIVSPPLLVTGNDLLDELNLEPGPIIGELLTHIRENQVTGDVTSRAAALNAAREYLQSG
jgi:tRNA nucleotidyltransferase/poly(A) polymerase